MNLFWIVTLMLLMLIVMATAFLALPLTVDLSPRVQRFVDETHDWFVDARPSCPRCGQETEWSGQTRSLTWFVCRTCAQSVPQRREAQRCA